MRTRFSPEQLLEIDARRICVIKPSALGDVVQTLPLLPALRERFPKAALSWVINRELAELLQGHPDLEAIIAYDRRSSWTGWTDLCRDLRRREFDLVFDLQGLLRTGVMTWATRAPRRVGLETAREGAHLACHCLIPDTGKQVPAHLRYWRVAEAIGRGELRRQTTIALTAKHHRWAEAQLGKLRAPARSSGGLCGLVPARAAADDHPAGGARPTRRPVLAVHPGARWVTKRYPVRQLAAVVQKAIRAYGFSVAILGSRAEVGLCHRLEQLLRKTVPHPGGARGATALTPGEPGVSAPGLISRGPTLRVGAPAAARLGKPAVPPGRREPRGENVLNLAGQTTLKQLAAVLNQSHCLLTNDSGPMHLAAGLGTPVVGIFTCTSALCSGPPGTQHELVSTTVACRASYKKRCPYSGSRHLACMEDLSAELVWRALVRLVNKNRIDTSAA